MASRRDVLLQGLFGAGALGLRALATGLPAQFFLRPRQAMAQQAADSRRQYLILSTSSAGDASNANAPGTYDFPAGYPANAVVHPKNDDMEALPMSIGGKTYQAAAPWTTLSAETLARTAFIHHGTLTANHGEQGRVLKLMGAVRRDEMATSMFAKTLAAKMGCVQAAPMALASEVTQFEGMYQPRYTPQGLKALLLGQKSPLNDLKPIRDDSLKQLYALYKGRAGTAPERRYIDSLALSHSDLRKVSENFADAFASITSDGVMGQCRAAVLMAKMNVAPIFTIHLPFGGDNHTDGNWASESTQTVSSLEALNQLMADMKTYQMQDRITFALLNVFGRNLQTDKQGRDHNPKHHVCVAIGANISPGVFGGVTPQDGSLNIDPTTGQGMVTGGIELQDSLASVGRTLGAAIGVEGSVIDDQITTGATISAALR